MLQKRQVITFRYVIKVESSIRKEESYATNEASNVTKEASYAAKKANNIT